jgi:hypothetical protein
MSPGASGLERDLHLVRRRAWVFIPFLILGVLIALALSRVSGDANAVATLQLETVVHDAVIGGDRGLRIFEAQSMTSSEPFKAKVRERLGDKTLDYARYSISLNPISVADGVARGVLTVAVVDPDKPTAERLRQAWVDTFVQEYSADDGLFRVRFLEKKQAVVKVAETFYQQTYDKLKPMAEAKGIPLDGVAASNNLQGSLPSELNKVEADLQRELAEIDGTLAAGPTGALASLVLKQPVSDAEAPRLLQARKTALQSAIASIRKQRAAVSDGASGLEFQALVDALRGWGQIKDQSNIRLSNAYVAITSAESTVDTSYAISGGFTGTSKGRVAIILAITVVFGLIAIYTLEWLSQLRRGMS